MGDLSVPRPGTGRIDLTYWWQHTVSVERWLRTGQGGTEVFATPVDVDGLYVDKERFVAGPNGEQILAAGSFYYPADVPFIPLQSRLTLPAVFASRVVRVVSESVRDTGDLPFSEYQEVGVV